MIPRLLAYLFKLGVLITLFNRLFFCITKKGCWLSNVVSSNHDGDSEKFLTPVASALRDSGYIVLDGVFQTEALQLLLIDIKNRSSDEFHVAGVGRS